MVSLSLASVRLRRICAVFLIAAVLCVCHVHASRRSKYGSPESSSGTAPSKQRVLDHRRRFSSPDAIKGLDPLRVPVEAFYDEFGDRPPGTLLLNMLVKNEEEHLNRTLPLWADVIDYWVIGVDDHNTDASREVIQAHLGHIPGMQVTVAFDGMGPAWSQVVAAGVVNFPQATHGLLADADFAPHLPDEWDKMDLDISCSKILYKLYDEAGETYRKLDWIYRNVRGAKVKRRMHQSLYVPPLGGLGVTQICEALSIKATERPGGYQDRAGGRVAKNQRYVGWLKKDLEDMPFDSRTVYYLGMNSINLYHAMIDDGQRGPAATRVLLEAKKWLAQRALNYVEVSEDNQGALESRWFSVLKLGEVCEMEHQTECAFYWYEMARSMDPDRAEPYLNMALIHRRAGRPDLAMPYLRPAARLRMPDRALFHRRELYECSAQVQLAAATEQLRPTHPVLTEDLYRDAIQAGERAVAQCPPQDTSRQTLARIMPELRARAAAFHPPPPGRNGSLPSYAQRTPFAVPATDVEYWGRVRRRRRAEGGSGEGTGTAASRRPPSTSALIGLVRSVVDALHRAGLSLSTFESAASDATDAVTHRPLALMWRKHLRQLSLLAEMPTVECPQFRAAVRPFVQFMQRNRRVLRDALPAPSRARQQTVMLSAVEELDGRC